MRIKSFFILVALLGTFGTTWAQESAGSFDHWVKSREGFKIEPLLMLQFWGLYASGEEVYHAASKQYQPVDDRVDVQVRRARFGFRAQPTDNLRFTTIAVFDGLGRDALAGTSGTSNNITPATIGILDVFMEWRMLPKKESLFLVAGYFRPQFSRESMTGAWALPSIEKSMSQNYIRRHLVGNGLGRSYGVNLGGVLHKEHTWIGCTYNVGLFTPQHTGISGITAGTAFAPLWVGRFAVDFGDPESTRYKINYDNNFYGARKGLTLAAHGAWQGETDQYHSNSGVGVDMLFNWKSLTLDAEQNWLWRSGTAANTSTHTGFKTGHIRAGYNLIAGKKVFLEPNATMMFFDGGLSAEDQTAASVLKMSSGKEKTFDIGVNWHLQPKKMKVLLHYTSRWGDAGAAGDGSQVNAFFSESGIGAIRRGNWLGLGFNLSI